MKERGILFSSPMVRANRAGLKSQTRRTRGLDKINEAPEEWRVLYSAGIDNAWWTFARGEAVEKIRNPYGLPGDILWSREAWKRGEDGAVYYRADNHIDVKGWPWKPGIHMFRKDSRDSYEVVSVRPERLQEIPEEDAIAEGLTALEGRERANWGPGEFGYTGMNLGFYHVAQGHRRVCCCNEGRELNLLPSICAYRELWESINGPGSWAKNPWCWRIEYKPLSPEGQEL